MKKIIILILLVLTTNCFSQKVDTVIITKYYTSYFCYKYHNPLFVKYELTNGGGNISRVGMNFTTNGFKQSATKQDYVGGKYDIGHMTNAEDFAQSFEAESSTFRFYNALPQTPKLNRGVWKALETKIRITSQKKTLIIICGGYNFNSIQGSMSVPDFCFKIIQIKNTKIIRVFIFNNDDSDTSKEISLDELKNITKYDFNKYFNI